jgi:hypothetical protein
MHDDTGHLWPELDWRWISSSTLARYEGCSVQLIHTRTIKGYYGPTGSTLVRWRPVPGGQSVKIREYLPAAIWRAQRRGRYADPSFDPRQVTARIFECDPDKTAARIAESSRTPVALSPDLQQILAQLSSANLTAMAAIKSLIGGDQQHTAQAITFAQGH